MLRWHVRAGDTADTCKVAHDKAQQWAEKESVFPLCPVFLHHTHNNFHIRQLTLLAASLRPLYSPGAPSPHLSTCGRINVTSYSVVNRQPEVHHLNQSSQPSQATAVTPGSTPIPDTAAGKCLPRRKKREGIKSVSIIFQRAAERLLQISQSVGVQPWVLTLSGFKRNQEGGD